MYTLNVIRFTLALRDTNYIAPEKKHHILLISPEDLKIQVQL